MPDATKAAHYAQLLNDARCEDNWDQVPELVRKVRKHAPDRACLTLTAETEHAITKANQRTVASERPSTEGPPAIDIDVPEQLSKLLAAIESEQSHVEDRFQGQVCVGWLHWFVKEYESAVTRLPNSLDQEYPQFEDYATVAEWTKVCALKSTYLKANCLARNGQRSEALEVFEASMPSLAGVWTSKPARKQLCYWSELFLTENCMLASQAIHSGDTLLTDVNCLSSFRAWLKYWSNTPGVTLAGGFGFKDSVPRRQVWSEYYSALSRILHEDLPYPTGYAPMQHEASARAQLRAELKKIETTYQGLLLSETKFPKAQEERQEVEEFVERLMQNWTLLSGRGWKEQDLGKGGREALSRGALDTLFAAATKTYHSTAILRHLFILHLAVAEFDLAFKSFDSYLDLVKKAKARVEKSGDLEPSLDDDATVLETISACIAALCRYGQRESAEKARDLGHELQRWLNKLSPPEKGHSNGASVSTQASIVYEGYQAVSPRVLALAWQSVGIAQAQWARMTYETEKRAQIQEEAVRALRRSLSSEFGRGADIRGVFALGLLLAEQRKLSLAIELVKTALLATEDSGSAHELYTGPYWRERSLIPLWHLLALMLSARQEYFMAARACEGAIEQFKDPHVLFGGRALDGGFRSEHLNESEEGRKANDGLVDEMDDFEKESILEIKMTQLAILEVVEGPTVAVNASSELLTLFPRLFGQVEPHLELAPADKAEPPKSSTGTLRSIRGSVFGGRSEKNAGKAKTHSVSTITEDPSDAALSRPQTTQTVATVAPTIQVTIEHSGSRSGRRVKKSDSVKRRSGSSKRTSLRRRDHSVDADQTRAAPSETRAATVVDGEKFFTPFDDLGASNYFTFSSTNTSAQATPIANAYKQPDPLADIAVDAVESQAAILPPVQLSPAHSLRRRRALLVRVWLTIASFYRKAELLDHARKACAEAHKIVQGLEGDVIKDTTASPSFRHVGWAEDKSIEQLHADVWAEKGYLSLASQDSYQARSDFEAALTHFPDHPSAIVGLSDILMDIYAEKLALPPSIPGLPSTTISGRTDTDSILRSETDLVVRKKPDPPPTLLAQPLGLGPSPCRQDESSADSKAIEATDESRLPPPYKATSLPLVDRLAARDRAYGLLSGLTKLGAGWNYSDAWFALARAYQESDQLDKAKDVLWWCVELEDARGVREWSCVGAGGYVL